MRVLAQDSQKTSVSQYHNDYVSFIYRGMDACMAEEANMPEALPSAILVLEKVYQENEFQLNCEFQITQTIADILLRKIRENL